MTVTVESVKRIKKRKRKNKRKTHLVGSGGGRRRSGAAGSRCGSGSDGSALLLGEGAGDQGDHEELKSDELEHDGVGGESGRGGGEEEGAEGGGGLTKDGGFGFQGGLCRRK